MSAPSIVSVPEHDLVRSLFSDLRTFYDVAIPPQTPWPAHLGLRLFPKDLGVKENVFGDIDALIVPYESPDLARAIEYKRILMPARTFTTLLPNKLHELRKGVTQANRLVAAGFAFVWLSILVIVDSRELTRPTGGYLAASGQLMNKVYEALPLADLNASVGVVVSEITQCFDRPVTESSMLGGHMLRMAEQNVQPQELTADVTRWIKSRRLASEESLGPAQ